MTPRLCRLCGERWVSLARLAAHDYRCTRCRHRTASEKRVNRRYDQRPSGRANKARSNAKRIYIGQRYHSYAATRDEASTINAHIKERLHAFTRQQAGTEVEGLAPDAVRVQAAVRTD